MTVNDWPQVLLRKEFLPQLVAYPVVNSTKSRQFSASNDARSESSSIWGSSCCSSIISWGRGPRLSIGSCSVIAAEAKDQLQQETAFESGLMHGQLGIRLLFEELVVVEVVVA